MRKKFYLVLALTVFLLASCGGAAQTSPEPPVDTSAYPAQGEPEAGRVIWERGIIGANPGCTTCHSLDAGVTMVGPSLAGIATTAAERVDGMGAEEYIRQSMLEPDAYVVEGFVTGTMPGGWEQSLSEQDMNNLVAFLMTLK